MSEQELRDLVIKGEAERVQMREELADARRRIEELYRDRRELYEIIRSIALESVTAREWFVADRWTDEASLTQHQEALAAHERAQRIANRGAGDAADSEHEIHVPRGTPLKMDTDEDVAYLRDLIERGQGVNQPFALDLLAEMERLRGEVGRLEAENVAQREVIRDVAALPTEWVDPIAPYHVLVTKARARLGEEGGAL